MIEWIETVIGLIIMSFIGTLIIGVIINSIKLKYNPKKYTDEYYEKNITNKPKPLFYIIFIPLFVTMLGKVLYDEGRNNAIAKEQNGDTMTLIVKLDSVKQEYNDHVGNDWIFNSSINGTKVVEGKGIIMTATTNDKISFNAEAIESDSVPDKGSGGTTIDIKDINLEEKNTYPIAVTVRENRGRYSGNTAEWNFNFSIERYIPLSEIVSNIFVKP